MSDFALKTSSISKDFWKKKSWFAEKELVEAVKDLNLEVRQGESVAFLGPNGAGKSTTIKLISGILKPTRGISHIAGDASGSLEANRKIGLVFGTRSQLWMYITVRQSLQMLGAIYSLSEKESERRIEELAELFEIGSYLDFPPNSLSLGERMRCEIVAGLIHKPSILLADEPTIGLDVVGKAKFRFLLKNWQEEEKTTLLLTSHDLSDVEALCQRAILINHGKIGYDGPLKGLKGELASIRNIKIVLAEPVNNIFKEKLGVQAIDDDPLIKKFQINLNRISPEAAMEHLMSLYKNSIVDLAVEEASLESIIGQWYKKIP